MRCGIGALVLLLAAARLSAADLSGEWQFAVTLIDDVTYARATLRENGEKLSGTLNGMVLEGTIKGDELTFTAKRPDGQRFATFTGRANSGALKGTATSWPGMPREVVWSAARTATPPAKPAVHDFERKEFHRVFSDAIPPLPCGTISPKSSIRSSTSSPRSARTRLRS